MKDVAAGDARLAAAAQLRQMLEPRSAHHSGAARPTRLEPRDEAFARHLAYGVLRWYSALEWLAGRLLEKPLKQRDSDIRNLILIGLFQLWQGDCAPHAAVHASAEAARRAGKTWAVGLVNAVLRRFQRERERLLEQLARQPQRYAHPEWLLEAVRNDWPKCWREILQANNRQPPMWLRINRLRTTMPEYCAMLDRAGLTSRVAGDPPEAVLVTPAVPVDQLPGFHEGLVSVQDAAAQLAAGLLAPLPGERILDACAAPGGKACHLLERCPGIELTALDLREERLALLQDNLRRLGLECRLMAGDAADPGGWWDGIAYDRILLDAPCSATGVIRRHPEIKWLRDPGQLEQARGLQQELLDGLWPLLKPGGILVYATCSILRRENSKQIHEFLSRHSSARCIGPTGDSEATGRQILPGAEDMDGFYYAVVLKSA